MKEEYIKQLGEFESTLGLEILPLPEDAYFPPLDTLRFRRMAGEIGGMYEVPRRFLFGTKGQGEYNLKDRRRIEKKLAQNGFNFLRNNPVVATPVVLNNQTILATLAGHDELRYSGKFEINKVPTVILPPGEQLTQIINAQSFIHGRLYEPQDVPPLLQRGVLDALQTFGRLLTSNKLPQPLGGINLQKAQTLFQPIHLG